MRINQFIAKMTGISRRDADKLIESGNVELDGELAQFHDQADENHNVRICVKGKWQDLKPISNNSVLLMYKPIFTLTTRSDPQKRKTIYNILPKTYHTLKPAGRLDYMSEGLLVLSNDGNFIDKLTHPKYGGEKMYLVALKFPLRREHIQEMHDGMTLDRETLNPVEVGKLSHSGQQIGEKLTEYDSRKLSFLRLEHGYYWYTFTLTEGKNNQIRNMCEAFGQKVLRLIRIKHGPYEISDQLYTKKYYKV